MPVPLGDGGRDNAGPAEYMTAALRAPLDKSTADGHYTLIEDAYFFHTFLCSLRLQFPPPRVPAVYASKCTCNACAFSEHRLIPVQFPRPNSLNQGWPFESPSSPDGCGRYGAQRRRTASTGAASESRHRPSGWQEASVRSLCAVQSARRWPWRSSRSRSNDTTARRYNAAQNARRAGEGRRYEHDLRFHF